MATLKKMYQITIYCCETKEKTRGSLHVNEELANIQLEYLRNNHSVGYYCDGNNHYEFGYETVYVGKENGIFGPDIFVKIN